MVDKGRQLALLLALTATAASTDAISYLGLGHVFPANMTGNTVLLGTGLAGADYAAAGRSACALGGFVAGAVLSGTVLAQSAEVHRSAVLAELAALAAFAGWWLAADHPDSATQHGLITLAGAAMGWQSGMVARLGAGVSTTYITGTWTSLSSWAGRRLRHATARRGAAAPRGDAAPHIRQAAVLACYFGTAVASGLLLLHVERWAAMVPLATALVAVARVP